jgi:hypothetical protein
VKFIVIGLDLEHQFFALSKTPFVVLGFEVTNMLFEERAFVGFIGLVQPRPDSNRVLVGENVL